LSKRNTGVIEGKPPSSTGKQFGFSVSSIFDIAAPTGQMGQNPNKKPSIDRKNRAAGFNAFRP
jgi:hypothetical protein